MEYLAFTLAISYLYNFVYWMINTNETKEKYIAMFITTYIIVLILLIVFIPILNSFLVKRNRAYHYIVENEQKLYILKTIHEKKLLLTNNPNAKIDEMPTFYKIVEQSWLLDKKIIEELKITKRDTI